VIYKPEMLSVVTLECGEIIGTYNTPDTVVRNRRIKYVVEQYLITTVV